MFWVFLTFFKVVLVLFVQKWKVKNIAFKTPLHIAVQLGRADVVDLLLQSGAIVDEKTVRKSRK